MEQSNRVGDVCGHPLKQPKRTNSLGDNRGCSVLTIGVEMGLLASLDTDSSSRPRRMRVSGALLHLSAPETDLPKLRKLNDT